jgi:2'-5' RNA ligase
VSDRVRAFVAIPFSDAVKSGIAHELASYRSDDTDVRWVNPEQAHLTLRFLGSVDRSRLAGLSTALAEAAVRNSRFQLTLHGTGAFPGFSRPRVLWIGVRPHPGLGSLHARVRDALATVGFDPEDRPFRPHVTVGRIKRGRHAGSDLIDRFSASRFEARCEVADIALVESVLGPGGARHRDLARFALGASGDRRL